MDEEIYNDIGEFLGSGRLSDPKPLEKGTFYNEQGKVTVTISGLEEKNYDIVNCQVQTAEGTDNILTPCLYTAATIRILTDDVSLYTSTLVGSEVTISAKDFHWHGKVVTNCANMDYNQDYEEIEIQAVDDLTLLKSEEYKGTERGTVAEIIKACMPTDEMYILCGTSLMTSEDWSAYPRPIMDRSGLHLIWRFAIISLSAMMPKDSSERLTKAEVLEAVLRYFSVRCLGYAKRVVGAGWPMVFATPAERKRCSNWVRYNLADKLGKLTTSDYDQSGTDGQSIIPLAPTTTTMYANGVSKYAGTAQVSLLDPYKSYSLTAKFPAIEIEDETFEECGRDEYQTITIDKEWKVKDDESVTYGWQQKYQKGSQSTYNRYMYVSPDIELPWSNVAPYPTLYSRSIDGINFTKDVTSMRYLERNTTYWCGAIHVSSACGEIDSSGQTDMTTPAGAPAYSDALMLYGMQVFASALALGYKQSVDGTTTYTANKKYYIPEYCELYRRKLPTAVFVTNSEKLYLVVNGSFRPTIRHLFPFFNSISSSKGWMYATALYDSKWRISCRLYLEDTSGKIETQDVVLCADISSSCATARVWNATYEFAKNVEWGDYLTIDGAKFEIPAGNWKSISFGIGLPYRILTHSRNYIMEGNFCAYCYITGLSFDLQYGRNTPDGDTNTKYGWNNEELQIEGSDVAEETEIVTDDLKNISNNIVCGADGYTLKTVQDSLARDGAETDAPESLRVSRYARQYAQATPTMSTTIEGAPNLLGVYKTSISSEMTIENYNFDLKTGLCEVTLVENKL